MRQTFEIVGSPAPDPANRPLAQYHIIGAGYFDALGVPLRARCVPSPTATPETAPEGLHRQRRAFVRRFLAGREPIGARVAIAVPGHPRPDSRIVRLSASCVR